MCSDELVRWDSVSILSHSFAYFFFCALAFFGGGAREFSVRLGGGGCAWTKYLSAGNLAAEAQMVLFGWLGTRTETGSGAWPWA